MSSSPKRRKHNWFAINKNNETHMTEHSNEKLKELLAVFERRLKEADCDLSNLFKAALIRIEELECNILSLKTPILMSASNPNGWTLEGIALQLASEMVEKDMNIQCDKRPQVIAASNNNKEIIDLFHDVRLKQLQNIALFAELGPDQGPTGKPRAGAGHE